jgi:membrane protease YdiL (CAAX protease family)
MIARARAYFEGLGTEPLVIVCGASAILVVAHHQGSIGSFHATFGGRFDALPFSAALGHFWWFGASLVFYLLVPLALSAVTGGSFHRRYGLGLGDWRAGLAISGLFLAVMLPTVALVSRWDVFRGLYPLAGSSAYTLTEHGQSHVSWSLFLAYETAYAAYFVAWEFFFRGWMVNGLLPHWGKAGAVLTQVTPFVVMHLGKAELEALGSVVAGVALGLLSLRTRSIWYGAVTHAAVAVAMDLASARTALGGP